MRNKVDELRHVFVNSDVHAILISETWLCADVPSSFVSIPGYNFYRNDRNDRRGGGVGIFVRNDLNPKKLRSSSGCTNVEYVCVLIDTGVDKCVLTSVYRPPGNFISEDFDEFSNSLVNLSHAYSNVIVGGDFNTNLLNDNTSVDAFLSVLQSIDLKIVNSQPTYFNCSNPSLLDLLLVTEKDNVLFYNQLSPPSIMDHDFLFMSCYILFDNSVQEQTYSYRDFKNIDLPSLFAECALLPWDNILLESLVDLKVEKFNTLISHLYDTYVPLRVKQISVNSCPWFNQSIRYLVLEREHLYKRWRRLRTTRSHSQYKAARNSVTAAIRSAKRIYFASKLDPSLPPKRLWTNLKRYGIHKDVQPECDINPDEMNQHFTSSPGISVSAFTQDGISSFNPGYTARGASRLRVADIGSFSFRCIDHFELFKAIYSIKSNAVGAAEINPQFIKLLLPHISLYILDIMNCCLMSSSFPSDWKIASVSPVPKKASPTTLSDYRPISILSFLAKVLEKVMALQIQTFLSLNDLLCELQSGFRPKHSCETALLKVSSDLRMALDVGNVGILVLLDFSKAFDSVDHSILLDKLYLEFGFSTSAMDLINSFLANRFQQVKINGHLSALSPLCRGVPQGSVLGPLLFCMYINDLPTVLQDVHYHLYADDVQIYFDRPMGLLEDCICRINDDLARIYNWSLENRLSLNPGKSQCIVLRRGALIDANELPPVILNNNVLPFVNTLNNLGVKLNSLMKCCDYVSANLGKIYGGLRRLWLSADVLPVELRLKLVRTLLLPYFTYGSLIFPKLDHGCRRKMEVAFNDCIRFVFNLRRSAHITPFKLSIAGCTIGTLLKRKSLTFLYNLIYAREPGYLANKIETLQSRRGRNLLIPRYNTSMYESSYFVQLARVWNSLPLSIQSAASVGEFRRLTCQHNF